MALTRRQLIGGSVGIGIGIGLASSRRAAMAQPSIEVRTVEELVTAIAPNRTLQLTRGKFTLSDLDSSWRSPYARFESVYDGYELVITDVDNLRLVGTNSRQSRLLTHPRYADVLKFQNCRNVQITDLELAHTSTAGFCRGGVLSFVDSADVQLERCVLYGSGTHGIEADGLNGLYCLHVNIRDCTYGILCLNRARDIDFESCQFFSNRGFSMIGLNQCQTVRFFDCLMYDNRVDLIAGMPPTGDDFMFNVVASDGVELERCTLQDNLVTYLATHPEAIALRDTTIVGNTFTNSLYPTDGGYQSPPLCPI
ncbi:MAG: right-handed parallel beta-helix repeat-containing protein [Leptolyngbyaceae cyanobacterium]